MAYDLLVTALAAALLAGALTAARSLSNPQISESQPPPEPAIVYRLIFGGHTRATRKG
ncbi:hypothetical protein NRB56_75520 [Nocardia sp. RB56]|uniref:Uncharacterized protein n=2 Tax=Nocardia aurantia TaxID=2585199 RepID=A0A7K0E1H3_9NOCA|nr:hypothetical protein [Nocardia aurantia]